MHSVQNDLLRILRAAGKLPLIVLIIAVISFAWAVFPPVPEPGTNIQLSHQELQEPALSEPAIGGIVQGDAKCGSDGNRWVPYPTERAGMEAVGGGMIDYLLLCRSDDSATLVAKDSAIEPLLNEGDFYLGGSGETLRITNWLTNDSGGGSGSIFTAIWAALAMLMVIPVRIAGFLVFQERSSGRLEWVLANQMSLRMYAWWKSAASTIGAICILMLLWSVIFAMALGFLKFVFLQSAMAPVLYAEGQMFMAEALSRGSQAFFFAGANLAAFSFAVSVLTVRMYLSSRFQLRATTAMEFGVLFIAFLPLAMPRAPEWVPLFGALTSLESAITGGEAVWHDVVISMGLSLVLGVVALTGFRSGRLFAD